MGWHSNECYVCLENFSTDRPRVLSYKCLHAVCFECWVDMAHKMRLNVINRCSICKAVRFRHPAAVVCEQNIITTYDGNLLYANNDLLSRDFIQEQIIKNFKQTCNINFPDKNQRYLFAEKMERKNRIYLLSQTT